MGLGCFRWFRNGNWNDVISSPRTNGNTVALFRDLDRVSANLTDFGLDGGTWHDQATSLRGYVCHTKAVEPPQAGRLHRYTPIRQSSFGHCRDS